MDANFPYVPNGLAFRVAGFLLYYLIALPLAWIVIRLINQTKIVNRKALSQIGGGFFLYGNHTHWSDSFLPHVVAAPKRTYIVANPDAVSIKGLRNIVLMLGTVPVPTKLGSLRKFVDALEIRCRQGACVAVYPEAHIWPYFTGVREFPDTSFRYPAKFGVPVVAMATTFHKRKGLLRFLKSPARTLTLSDPIYAPAEMTMHEAQLYFHQRVYAFMKENTERQDNYASIRYIQK